MSNIRQEAIKRAQEIWNEKPVFLDTETTGLGEAAQIVEICIIDSDGEELFKSLVKPSVKIPPETIAVHNITDEIVANAPTWFQVLPKIQEVLRNRLVGAYNAEFDLRLMMQSHFPKGARRPDINTYMSTYLNAQFFCIMNLYMDYSGSSSYQSLETAGEKCGITLPNSHRACDDTYLARELFLYIAGVLT